MRAQEREEQLRRQQDHAIGEFNERQARRYRVGRAMVITLGVLHLLNALLLVIADFELLRLVFQFVPAVLLLCGVAWSRYVLAAFAAVDATLVLFVVCSGYIGFDDPHKNLIMVLLVVAYVLYDAVTSVLLFSNKMVSLYLYERKHRVKKIWE